MISRINEDFRRDYAALPEAVKKQVTAAYRLFISDHDHPGLRFKKLPPHADIWSVRITSDYRAIGRWRGNTIVWFFVGSHADYDKVLDRL
jgi:mRNA-degrading endonuclease RelE of RelBE toxin-antitoxin system